MSGLVLPSLFELENLATFPSSEPMSPHASQPSTTIGLQLFDDAKNGLPIRPPTPTFIASMDIQMSHRFPVVSIDDRLVERMRKWTIPLPQVPEVFDQGSLPDASAREPARATSSSKPRKFSPFIKTTFGIISPPTSPILPGYQWQFEVLSMAS